MGGRRRRRQATQACAGPPVVCGGRRTGHAVGVLKSLRSRLTKSNEDLHAEALQARFEDDSCSAIGEVRGRGRVRLHGEVAALQVVPRAGAPSLEVTVDDGTGRAVAVFTGRKRIGGLDPGRPVLVEGVARRERGRLLLINPAYTLHR